MTTTSRTPQQVLAHYEIEKKLAAQLRMASRLDRRRLYSEVYDQMFRLVPDHPQLTRKVSEDEARAYVVQQLALVRRYLRKDCVFVEVGPGDCALCIEVAKTARQVYAIDVSAEITERNLPANCVLILSDGSSISVPAGTIDVAFSNQLIEHLHPEDALDQLKNLVIALTPGGRYLCVTPSRLYGPHDISAGFDNEATGFHLKEYTYRELVSLYELVGFRNIKALIGGKGLYMEVPASVVVLIEVLCAKLPKGWLTWRPFRILFLSIQLVGTK